MIRYLIALALLLLPVSAGADVGDPQVRTDHPWYPGELACSTFPRLFATEAEVYRRVTGITPVTDEQKALASWLWRNTHYWHAEEGAEDLWGRGFTAGLDMRSREYWTGLFADGCGVCGTTLGAARSGGPSLAGAGSRGPGGITLHVVDENGRELSHHPDPRFGAEVAKALAANPSLVFLETLIGLLPRREARPHAGPQRRIGVGAHRLEQPRQPGIVVARIERHRTLTLRLMA